MSDKTLAIVGGGAAGLMAAVAAGERVRQLEEDLRICVYERDDRVGRSILATGNGRCNFSNEDIKVSKYRNYEFVRNALWSLSYSMMHTEGDRYAKIVRNNGSDVHAFFYRHGLMWRTEGEGRQYPWTNKASTVLDILRESCARVGVEERCGIGVEAIEEPKDQGGRFTLRMADGSFERADAVVVACGGGGLPRIDVLDGTLKPLQPMLGPLAVAKGDIPFVRELDNIRVRCKISLKRQGKGGAEKVVAYERGELMFRKYGVSGIAVFNLSRMAKPGDMLCIDFLDVNEMYEAIDYLYSRRKMVSATLRGPFSYDDILRGLLLPRVSEAVLKRAGIAPSTRFEKADVPALAELLCGVELEVAGIGDEKICQVHRGGIVVGAVDPRTMQAKSAAGLYLAGEALDVDGPCGGYNLHWAWASGMLAGRAATEGLVGCPSTPKFIV